MRLPSLPPWLTLLLLLSLTTSTLSALTTTPGSFCKCICNTNSTIIALNPPTTSNPPSPHILPRETENNQPTHHKLSCTDCTRSFCLSYNLPICKDVPEDKIFTSCFQRDSLKDELVIYLFLAVTTGLLVWAGVKPWVERLWEKSGFAGRGTPRGGQGRNYPPVGAGAEGVSRNGGLRIYLQEGEDGRSIPR
jgi:hypothetical protein